MGVEQEARPVGCRHGPGDEVCDGYLTLVDGRLVLCSERARGLRVGAALDDDSQPAVVDPRPDVDREVERCRAELLEPKRCSSTRSKASRQPPGRGASTVAWPTSSPGTVRGRMPARRPTDRVPERVEPVVGELDAFLAARPPRRRAGVLELESCVNRYTGTRFAELVGEPAGGKRPGRNGMLTDALHVEG
jgi:hypothetical protein